MVLFCKIIIVCIEWDSILTGYSVCSVKLPAPPPVESNS